MKTKIVRTLVLAGLTSAPALGQVTDGLDRAVLPIPEPQYPISREPDRTVLPLKEPT